MKEFDHLFELEKELHTSEVRSNAERISQLLSLSFFEFGSSGKVWTREDILSNLPSEDGLTKIESSHYKATPLTQDVVLITYISTRIRSGQQQASSLRSSIWRKNNDFWQMEFHQGTPKQD
jgi:hypothetical protein